MNEKLNRQILNVLTLTGPSTADQVHETLKQSRKATMDALEELEAIGTIVREFNAALNCSVFSLLSTTPAAKSTSVKTPQKQPSPVVQELPKRGRPVKKPEPKPLVETTSVQDSVIQETDIINMDGMANNQKEEALDKVTAVKKVRTKPFTPNPTRGYEAKHGYVKIFLERRACSRTLTLTVDDLKELLRAAEKAA